MRLKPEIKTFIKESAEKLFPGAEIYLFGSRVHDDSVGGDIDLLVLSPQKIDAKTIRSFRINFYKRFGWQKIDIVNFTKTEKATFKKLILTEAKAI